MKTIKEILKRKDKNLDKEIEQKLKELYNSELFDLANGDAWTKEEKEACMKNAERYNSMLNDTEKRNSSKASKFIEVAIPTALGIITLVVNVAMFKTGLRFEKEGTVTSFFVKDMLSKRPRR